MASSGRLSLKSSSQSFFMIPALNYPYSLIDYLKIGKNGCSQTAVTKQLEVNASSMIKKKKN